MVVIDEIQRLPELLNEVHRLIEKRGTRFLLTGSSARKLRRGGVNLLGGRARTRYLHPLIARELGRRFDLARAVARGTLPSIYFSDDPQADLDAYAGSYLQQEIVAEGATRNVPAFSRFLRVAAHCNGTIVNFTNVANDAQVPRTTVYEYFEILKDTLVLHELPAWRKSQKRKPLASSKFYFFDVGVVATLQGRRFRPGTPEFGEGVETYLMHELVALPGLRLGRAAPLLAIDLGVRGRLHPRRSHGDRGEGQGNGLASGPEVAARPRRGAKAQALRLREPRGAPEARRRARAHARAGVPGRPVER